MVVTSYLEYQTIGGETVLVAVDDVPGPLTERASLADAAKAVVKTAGMGFDAALGTVTAVARSFTRQFANNEDRPREMELLISRGIPGHGTAVSPMRNQ
jgi:hypothetical protein